MRKITVYNLQTLTGINICTDLYRSMTGLATSLYCLSLAIRASGLSSSCWISGSPVTSSFPWGSQHSLTSTKAKSSATQEWNQFRITEEKTSHDIDLLTDWRVALKNENNDKNNRKKPDTAVAWLRPALEVDWSPCCKLSHCPDGSSGHSVGPWEFRTGCWGWWPGRFEIDRSAPSPGSESEENLAKTKTEWTAFRIVVTCMAKKTSRISYFTISCYFFLLISG